ncbi:prolactin receptor b [Pholidichthys leucotaenia]
MRGGVALAVLLLLSAAAESNRTFPPGKPVLLGCRSPEKETFTCWWNPGSDGGLPTTHHLYYQREGLERTLECPDYHSKGANSCFFDKSHTSVWVDYYIWVAASNAHGTNSSDPLNIDVVKIVKPNVPENITLVLKTTEGSPSLHITWEPPHNTDIQSGWATLKYEVRVKQVNSNVWTNYTTSTQASLSLYTIHPGGKYMVQVRCTIDNGHWSEWSNATFVKVPNSPVRNNERAILILVFTLAAVPLLAALCMFLMKRKDVKRHLLPPVPGPKIKGFNVQHLKSGRSEKGISALIVNHHFPPMMAWQEQMEDFLLVSDKDDWILSDPLDSQKKKKCLIIPSGLNLDMETQSMESTSSQSDAEKVEVGHSEEGLSNMELLNVPPQQQKCPSMNTVVKEATHQHKGGTESIIQPLGISGYVDIQRNESPQQVNMTKVDYSRVKDVDGDTILTPNKDNTPLSLDIQKQERLPEDYGRVKEVNSDNVILLIKQSGSCNRPCQERADDYAHMTNQQPATLHMAGPSKVEVCMGLIGGYVDTVPAGPLI